MKRGDESCVFEEGKKKKKKKHERQRRGENMLTKSD